MSETASPWLPPPQDLLVEDGEVHIWRVSLDQPSGVVQQLERTLAADEWTRAQKYYFPKDRIHYTVARGILRALLSRYLAVEPAVFQFSYNTYGKPSLARSYGDDPFFFNVSHSHGLALIAFARFEAMGVDVEYINSDIECASIAGHFFSPNEVSMLLSVPADMQASAFFNCWTRKEAYIKARGMGVSLGLNTFDVSLLPDAPTQFLAIREGNQDITQWSLYTLAPGEGYKGALAVQRTSVCLRLWQWPGI